MSVRAFLDALRLVRKRLEAYPESSDPETVHQMRTSLRRMESAYQAMPKAARTKRSDGLVADLMDFFRMNGRIRNLDIILEKLYWYGHGPDSAAVAAVMILRERQHKKTLKAASRLGYLIEPPLMALTAKPADTAKLELRILRLSTVVSGNESRVNDLHTLRKLIKRLRYTMEATPGADSKTISCLKKLQGTMGDIHDCDMFVAFMKKHGAAMDVGHSTILAEEAHRHRKYRRLAAGLGPDGNLQRFLYGPPEGTP